MLFNLVWRTCTKNWCRTLKAFSTLDMEIWLDGPDKVFNRRKVCTSTKVTGVYLSPRPTGVLLLNAVLTVRAHQANSHKDKGWETFTDAVVQWLSNNLEGLVFMLWGAYAQKKGAAINRVGVLCFKRWPRITFLHLSVCVLCFVEAPPHPADCASFSLVLS